MPSYKIHSLKDSNKLSFIIEGESESSVQQKLSSEGYIVLSVEKTEIDTKNIFVFEGKKPDKTFIEGKIGADDIFMAYEMLKGQYNYSITKLYPSFITDAHEQEKIFNELLSTFDEKKILVTKVAIDTMGKNLQKNKTFIEKIKTIIQSGNIENKEGIIADLKKLELINNNATIHQSLQSIVKELLKSTRSQPETYQQVKPIAADLGLFIPPDTYFSFLNRTQAFFNFLQPIFHPEEYTPSKIVTTPEIQKNTFPYENVRNNVHIRTLIRKKYQQVSLLQMADSQVKQSYLYSVFRSKQVFYFLWRALFYVGYVLRMTLFVLCLGLLTLFFLGRTTELFVFPLVLGVFFLISFLSLVIPGETV